MDQWISGMRAQDEATRVFLLSDPSGGAKVVESAVRCCVNRSVGTKEKKLTRIFSPSGGIKFVTLTFRPHRRSQSGLGFRVSGLGFCHVDVQAPQEEPICAINGKELVH
jgi:hypothetical protein